MNDYEIVSRDRLVERIRRDGRSVYSRAGKRAPIEACALPVVHRVRMRTTNGLERLNKELKRRTRVAALFPNAESCLRLISAMLAEQDDEWLSAKIYLSMTL